MSLRSTILDRVAEDVRLQTHTVHLQILFDQDQQENHDELMLALFGSLSCGVGPRDQVYDNGIVLGSAIREPNGVLKSLLQEVF